MDFPAQNSKKKQVLITNVGSYLGSQLAASQVLSDFQVFGVGTSHLIEPLLAKESFTLLELNLSQPLPSYLPKFDYIFDLNFLKKEDSQREQNFLPKIPPALNNLLTIADESRIFVIALIETDLVLYEYLTKGIRSDNIKLFLIGDLYGEGMPLKKSENELASLIHQAVSSQRVIIQNEGLDLIYPAYISDAIFAVNKLAFIQKAREVEIIVSEEAKTALTVAYELQSASRVILQKDLGLYFADAKKRETEAALQIHLDYSPKIKLDEGLKRTLEYFRDSQDKKEPPERIRHSPQISEKISEIEGRKSASIKDKFMERTKSFQGMSSRLPSNIPLSGKGLRPKTVIFGIILVFLLIIAKTGLDLYLGIKNLSESKKQLESGNLETAKKKAASSAGSTKAAKNKIDIFTYPIRLIAGSSMDSVDSGLLGITRASEALGYFIEGGQNLKTNLAQAVTKDVKNESVDEDSTRAYFRSAYFTANLSKELLNQAQIPFVSDYVQRAKEGASTLANISQSAGELSTFFNQIVGEGQPRTYLILLLNNNELRPGGGFIGNFALVEFDKAKLKTITVEDIYQIDGQLKETIEPPRQLKEKLGVERFYLRDSNWTGDFPTNTQTARDFFKKETGKDVNGVITVDLSFVENLLSALGPVTLEDYKEEITAQNLFEKAQYYSEIGFTPGSTQKKDFMSALTKKVVDTTIASLAQNNSNNKSKSPLFAFILSAKQALEQKHIMLTVDGTTLSAFIEDKGWNPRLPSASNNPADDTEEARDFISIVEANVGANKVNHYIERKVDYEMTVGRDADLVGKLSITYKNNSQAETWPAGKYVNYLRVYVPFTADLFAYDDGQSKDPKSVEVASIAGLTQFATTIEVPVKSTRTVTFTYRIPKNIKLDTAPAYRLYVQKQAGTEKDPFTFTFNLPAYLEAKSVSSPFCHPELGSGSDECSKVAGKQNFTIESDLQTDRSFKVEVGKK